MNAILCHKAELHQRLIKGWNLSAVAQLSKEECGLEVRQAAQELCRHSSDLLTIGPTGALSQRGD